MSNFASLPNDPDIEVDSSAGGAPRPVHLRLSFLLLVAVGGTFGSAARAGFAEAFPYDSGFPSVILAINLVGAFLLGVLLEFLANRGPDAGRCRTLRLLVGTGFVGGFTTYSTLAVDGASLIRDGATPTAISYTLATVIVGAIATFAGMVTGTFVHRTSERSQS